MTHNFGDRIWTFYEIRSLFNGMYSEQKPFSRSVVEQSKRRFQATVAGKWSLTKENK